MALTVSETLAVGRAAKRRQIWSVGGGKGGIGKSLISASVGWQLARMGQRVVLVDADLGGANLHTCLGLPNPARTLYYDGGLGVVVELLSALGHHSPHTGRTKGKPISPAEERRRFPQDAVSPRFYCRARRRSCGSTGHPSHHRNTNPKTPPNHRLSFPCSPHPSCTTVFGSDPVSWTRHINGRHVPTIDVSV